MRILSKYLLPILLVLFLVSPALAQVCGGAECYVDCSAGSSGDGTYGSPWNKVSDVNDNTGNMATGQDVYFKIDTECEISGIGQLTVLWDGTSGNQVIIGCYEGNDDFCEQGEYAILDGDEDDDGETDINAYFSLLVNYTDVVAKGGPEAFSWHTYQNIKFQHGYRAIALAGEAKTNSGRCWIDGDGGQPSPCKTQADDPPSGDEGVRDGNITTKWCHFYRNWAANWLVHGNIENVTFTENLEEEGVYTHTNIRDSGAWCRGASADTSVEICNGFQDPALCCTDYQEGYCRACNSSCDIVKNAGRWAHNGYWEGHPKNIIWSKSEIKNCGREYANIYHPHGMIIEKNKFWGHTETNYGLNICSKHEGLDPLIVRYNIFEGNPDPNYTNRKGFKAITFGDGNIDYNECFETQSEIRNDLEFGNAIQTGDASELDGFWVYGNSIAGFSGPYNDGYPGSFINFDTWEDCKPQEMENLYVWGNHSIENDIFIFWPNGGNFTFINNSHFVNNNTISSNCSGCADYACWNSGALVKCEELAETVNYDANFYTGPPKFFRGGGGTLYDATWAEGANDVDFPNYNGTLGLANPANWRNLTFGELDGPEFALGSTSDLIDAGIQVATSTDDCVNNITAACIPEMEDSDYTPAAGSSINVPVKDNNDFGTGPEVGADNWTCVPAKPSITDPTPSETDVELDRTITSSAFSDQTGCSTSHVSSDWETCLDSACMQVDQSVYSDTGNKTSWMPILSPNAQLYVRVRHNNSNGNSQWSDAIYFETVGGPVGGDVALLIDGDNNIVKWSIVDCEAEQATGIKVASGADGNKFFNTTVVDCGEYGMEVDANIELKNTLFHDNAGPDIDYTGVTITAGNNSFEDADPGGGTYNSGTSDWSKVEKFFCFASNDFRLRRTSYGVDKGTDAIYSGSEVDIMGRDATDNSGNFISGAGIDIGAFESVPFLQRGPMSFGFGYGLN